MRRREFLHLTCNENTQVRILPVPLADDPSQARPIRSSGVAAKLTALSRPNPRFESGLEHVGPEPMRTGKRPLTAE